MSASSGALTPGGLSQFACRETSFAGLNGTVGRIYCASFESSRMVDAVAGSSSLHYCCSEAG